MQEILRVLKSLDSRLEKLEKGAGSPRGVSLTDQASGSGGDFPARREVALATLDEWIRRKVDDLSAPTPEGEDESARLQQQRARILGQRELNEVREVRNAIDAAKSIEEMNAAARTSPKAMGLLGMPSTK